MITQERLKELFHYCPETGLVTRRVTVSNSAPAGTIAGSTCPAGYLRIYVDGTHYYSHRLAILYVYGAFPSCWTDHINGIKDDNRIVNLRCVSISENSKNQKLGITNTSGIMGVRWEKGRKRWQASVSINGRGKVVGSYKYKWDAICARKSAELKYGYHDNHGRIC